MTYNIFGDIAGRYDELILLKAKMPPGVPVSVGDMVDRGKQSREVLNHFNVLGKAVKANHEHLMIDFYRQTNYYDLGLWFMNGGVETLRSYLTDEQQALTKFKYLERIFNMYGHGKYISREDIKSALDPILGLVRAVIPEAMIAWLEGLPYSLELEGGALITHAAINPVIPLQQCFDIGEDASTSRCDNSVLWNRGRTRRMDGKFQIHGHTAYRNVTWLEDREGIYGVNLDTSLGKKLTGIHWPSMQVFEQEYLG